MRLLPHACLPAAHASGEVLTLEQHFGTVWSAQMNICRPPVSSMRRLAAMRRIAASPMGPACAHRMVMLCHHPCFPHGRHASGRPYNSARQFTAPQLKLR